ncbi:MAG TPA: glycosyltransferase family 2 protein [Candidatus Dormibacteraeota bacterium]|nr:glycosyltransferase family 2 protein [Candidatus Dormibacteraeota bacterium]
MDPDRITAVVLTKDEAANVEGCLASLPPGVGALVVDAESRDATREIAERAGARVVVRPWTGFVDARRAALTMAWTPWVLFVDADERLDRTLRTSVLAAPEGAFAAYEVLRTTEFCGRPMRGAGWWQEPLVRLVRRDAARLEARPAAGGAAQLHERWVAQGPVGRLTGTLEHRSYPTLADYRRKFARYTEIEAQGVTPSPARAARALVLSAARLAWLYLARGGWRDGWRGAYVCAASAFYPSAVQLKALARSRSEARR